MRLNRLRSLSWSLVLLLFVNASAHAQFEPGDFQLIPELSQINTGGGDHNLAVEAKVRPAPQGQHGILEVTATMGASWHIYSLTQPPGGPNRTTIHLESDDDFRLLGSFVPDRPAKIHFESAFEMDVEEFVQKVTWSVPISWTGGRPPTIRGYLDGQVCAESGGCVPIGKGDEAASFESKVADALETEEAQFIPGVRLKGIHTPIRGWLSTSHAKPGDTVQLHIAFDPDQDWHVYAYAPLPPSPFQRPTLIETSLPNGWKQGPARAATPIVSEESPIPDDPPIRYYDGPVTITVPIEIPSDAAPGTHSVTGHVAYQTCATSCDRPIAAAWQTTLHVTQEPPKPTRFASLAMEEQPSDYDAVLERLKNKQPTDPASNEPEKAPAETASNQVAVVGIDGLEVEDDGSQDRSLIAILGLAFVGGFVLNFMPCVLPVIGLKIMSFVEQAGANRVRAFGLNAWYALGMISVFWILAVLAAAPTLGLSESGLGWGQQFNYQFFTIPLVCLIFAMGLSFLGVWEIPIPGFATGSAANALAEKQGYSGAFFKGAITTVLATPCGAPGLATAYGWVVQTQSASLAFLVFTVLGLGMAFPYLLIGAFPSLIRFLPKPGAWMDTFKQLMGFVLLGTVIFLMQNVNWSLLLPTTAMLFGIWFACWWIGRVPFTAEPARRRRAWAIALVIVLISATISFGRHFDAFGLSFRGVRGWAEQKFELEIDRIVGQRASGVQAETRPVAKSASKNELPWEPFSLELLDELRASQTTVLIDFTADW